MPKSTHDIPGIGTVHVTKKRGQRTMRLRVDNKGLVQVSMPWYVPKSTAMEFIATKKQWILDQQAEYVFEPYDGMLLGKTLRLRIIENSAKTRSKAAPDEVVVHFAGKFDQSDASQTGKVHKAIMAALRTEAERILLPRLSDLAELYGFSYSSGRIKKVTGRWGSCDSNKQIALSLYLVQMPIEFIDYVIIHELAHTKHLNHSQQFWAEVARYCPDYKELRKQMRDLRPKIYDAKTFMS